MKQNTETFSTTLNHQITVFRNDYIGRKIKLAGLYEKENLELLLSILKQISDPVVLDIGANIGNHALAFSTVAKCVYGFEPLPIVFALLKKNIEQNHIHNIKAFNFALSADTEDATIYMVKEGNVGASSFDKREDNVEPIIVNKKIGDDFISDNNIKKIDLLKIDVEAHEVFVLRGLMNTIQQHKPIITLEWNDPLTIERLKNSVELEFLLKEYTIYVLGSNYDRGYWKGAAFPFIQRKCTRFFKKRTAALYQFNPQRLYKNLLLVPKGREDIVSSFINHYFK